MSYDIFVRSGVKVDKNGVCECGEIVSPARPLDHYMRCKIVDSKIRKAQKSISASAEWVDDGSGIDVDTLRQIVDKLVKGDGS